MWLLVVCIVCWGVWGFTQKLAVQNSSPLMMLMMSSYLYSIIGPLVFVWMRLKQLPTDWNITGFLWTTVGCLLGVGASLAYASAAKKTPIFVLSATTAVYPIISLLLAWCFLNETITVKNIIGIICVVFGLFLVGI